MKNYYTTFPCGLDAFLVVPCTKRTAAGKVTCAIKSRFQCGEPCSSFNWRLWTLLRETRCRHNTRARVLDWEACYKGLKMRSRSTVVSSLLLALLATVVGVGGPCAHAAQPVCVGDCSGDGQITVDELLALVNIC